MKIARYRESYKDAWNAFVSTSINSTFLHKREYMDYHSDRFVDHSLLFYSDKDQLLCILPANETNDELISHQGLTYGGFLMSEKFSFEVIRLVFETLHSYLKKNGFKKFYLKVVPDFYTARIQDSEHYLMWRLGGNVSSILINSVVCQQTKTKFKNNRMEGVKKMMRNKAIIEESNNYSEFWDVLTGELRSRHQVQPVHSLQEMSQLKQHFPENIRLYVCRDNKCNLLAGTVLYISKRVVHVQYISSTQNGRIGGAVDFLFYKLVNEVLSHIPFFDFGHSNECGGQFLNKGLYFQKEGFGGMPRAQYIWKFEVESLTLYPEDLLT